MKPSLALAFTAGIVASAAYMAAAAHTAAATAGEARGWRVYDTVDEMTDEPKWYAAMVPEEEIGADGDLRYPTINRLMRVDCDDGIPRVIVQFAALDLAMSAIEMIQYRFDKEPVREVYWEARGNYRGVEGDAAWPFLDDLEEAQKLILKRGSDKLHFTVSGSGPVVGKLRELCNRPR